MQSSFNVYRSDWLYGFGRFIVITTSQYDINGADIISEAFVFAFDSVPQTKPFQAMMINYKSNPENKGKINIDIPFMEQEAQRQAMNCIYEYQYEEYNKSKDIDLIDKTFKLQPVKADALISLKINGDYEAELKSVVEYTKSDDLKKYITLILSLPKLEIKNYTDR